VTSQTPAFAIVSLDRLTGPGPMPPGTGQRRVRLQSCGAGQAWLSNATTISAADAYAVLGYFGYRRLTFNLGPEGYIADAG
jgi:hypothetical protein